MGTIVRGKSDYRVLTRAGGIFWILHHADSVWLVMKSQDLSDHLKFLFTVAGKTFQKGRYVFANEPVVLK